MAFARIRTNVGGALIALAGALFPLAGGQIGAGQTTAHDFQFSAIGGQPLPFSHFKGKTVLVVNTASLCGFTPQYAKLQQLWEEYRDRGLVVLGVPSNDFGGQEPGNEAEIKEFCEVNFSIDFPLTSKVVVRGRDAHPFYRWAADQLGPSATPKWNFHKYLVSPDGRLVDWFSTTTPPTSDRVKAAIEKYLPDRTKSS